MAESTDEPHKASQDDSEDVEAGYVLVGQGACSIPLGPVDSETQSWGFAWVPAYLYDSLTAIGSTLCGPTALGKDWGSFLRSLLYFTRFGYNILDDHICVVGRNQSYVLSTVKEIKRLSLSNIKVSQRHITCEPQCSCSHENFDGAHFVIIVATADPRMMLVSDTEESQIGNILKRAKSTGASILILLAGHRGSQDMTESKLFEPSLEELCKNQQEIGQLAAEGRFISRGFSYEPENMTFNQKQQEQIEKWIAESLEEDNADQAKE